MSDNPIMDDIAFEMGKPRPDPKPARGMDDADRNILWECRNDWKENPDSCDTCDTYCEECPDPPEDAPPCPGNPWESWYGR